MNLDNAQPAAGIRPVYEHMLLVVNSIQAQILRNESLYIGNDPAVPPQPLPHQPYLPTSRPPLGRQAQWVRSKNLPSMVYGQSYLGATDMGIRSFWQERIRDHRIHG